MFRGCVCGYNYMIMFLNWGKLTNQGDISRPIRCLAKVVLSSVTNQKLQKKQYATKAYRHFSNVLLSQNHTWLKTNRLIFRLFSSHNSSRLSRFEGNDTVNSACLHNITSEPNLSSYRHLQSLYLHGSVFSIYHADLPH